jgi:hypothetical protein
MFNPNNPQNITTNYPQKLLSAPLRMQFSQEEKTNPNSMTNEEFWEAKRRG